MKWGKHEDPRYFHYNFPYSRASELERWYRAKKQFMKKWIYAIEVDRRVVGYITLKNVKWAEKRGEMGIALDPDCVNKGIGTRAICLYLLRVFRNFFIDRVELKTSAFNERAISCYRNIGFEQTDVKRELFEEQAFRIEILSWFPRFEHDNKKLYVNYHYMEISKEQFLKRYIE